MDIRIIGVIIFLGTVCHASNSTSDESLQQVIVFFKHGEHAIRNVYPKDPLKNHKWTVTWGMLTEKGKKRLKNLGTWLRKQYVHLNNGEYDIGNTKIYVIPTLRNNYSGRALLAGLYPKNVKSGDPFASYIAMYRFFEGKDQLITMDKPCKRLADELKKVHDKEKKNRSPQRRSFMEDIAIFSGSKMENLADVQFLYEILVIEKMEDLLIPKWARSCLKGDMMGIVEDALAISTENDLLKRFRSGPLLKQIIREMQFLASGKDSVKIRLFGVDDDTLVSFMRTMGVSEYNGKKLKPKYGATLIFELRKDDKNRYYVTVRYMNDSEDEKTDKLTIPACKGTCYLDQMSTQFEKVLPSNWEEECANNNHSTNATCDCNNSGVDRFKEICDIQTGICNCLPHVVGKTCDKCEENYWRFGNPAGCIECKCSKIGSVDNKCDMSSGLCFCRQGHTGPFCEDCKKNYYKRSTFEQCLPCNCDKTGSVDDVCIEHSGKCACRKGFSGIRCENKTNLGSSVPVNPILVMLLTVLLCMFHKLYVLRV